MQTKPNVNFKGESLRDPKLDAAVNAVVEPTPTSQARVEAGRVARLRQRIEREAVFGERCHRMTRDEETFVLVALRLLARTLNGETVKACASA